MRFILEKQLFEIIGSPETKIKIYQSGIKTGEEIRDDILRNQEIVSILEAKARQIKNYMDAESGSTRSIGLYRFISDILGENPNEVLS